LTRRPSNEALALVLFTICTMVGATVRPWPARATPREGAKVNRCGCYEDGGGKCRCLRKSRCGCPGECEPLGCEERRQEDLVRRMEQELRKIQEGEGRVDEPDRQPKDPESSKDGVDKQRAFKGRKQSLRSPDQTEQVLGGASDPGRDAPLPPPACVATRHAGTILLERGTRYAAAIFGIPRRALPPPPGRSPSVLSSW
jgi:hypothetical protein